MTKNWIDRASRYFIGAGLQFLVFVLILVLLDLNYQAELPAEVSFILLMVGVILATVEHFWSERVESKKKA